MSSIKFDEVACENVIKALDDVSLILGEVSGDVQEFLNGNPSLTAIDRQIKRKSTKTRTIELEDGTTEEETYIDSSTQNYYNNNYRQPIINATSNISSVISNIDALKTNVDDIDTKVKGIQEAVAEYDGTGVDIDTDGLPSGTPAVAGGPYGNGGDTETPTGPGPIDGRDDEDTTVPEETTPEQGDGLTDGRDDEDTTVPEETTPEEGDGPTDDRDDEDTTRPNDEGTEGSWGDNQEDDSDRENDSTNPFDPSNGDSSGFNDNINDGDEDDGGAGSNIWGDGFGGPGTGGNGENGDGTDANGAGLFPFLAGNDATSSDGENPDFIFRGLYDGSGNGDGDGVNVGGISLDGLNGGDGSGVSKGSAIIAGAGAVGLGIAGVDAAATVNEKLNGDELSFLSEEEKEKKKFIKTVVSSSILGLVSLAFILVLFFGNSILGPILLGIAMVVSALAATSGLKFGKFIAFGVMLGAALLTFILSAFDVIPQIGYIVSFLGFVILGIGAYLLDLLNDMFDNKIDVLPILIAISLGLFVAMLKVVEVINWIVFIILLLLVVGGYLLYEKVLKDKLGLANVVETAPVVDNTVVNTVQTQPVEEQKESFDPRSLFKEEESNIPVLSDRVQNNNMNNGNPFMDYNPQNSSFNNAFNDENTNNNNDDNNYHTYY